MARQGERHAAQPAAPPEAAPALPVAGGQLRVERVGLGEPALGQRPGDANRNTMTSSEPPGAPQTAWRQPRAPRASRTSRRLIAWSRTQPRSRGTTVLGPRLPLEWPTTWTTARGLTRRPGIDGDGPSAPHDRPAPLELLHRQVDALSPERGERGLDALAPDQAFEVAGLTPGVRQERAVRAGRVGVDEVACQAEEVGLAGRQPRPHRRSGLGAGDLAAEEAGRRGKETGGHAKVLENLGPQHREAFAYPARSAAVTGGAPRARRAGGRPPGRWRAPTRTPGTGDPASRGSRRPPARRCCNVHEGARTSVHA